MNEDEVEQFIQFAGVDDKAATALRQCEPDLQVEVMAVGPLTNAKNPSSALLGRIRAIKQTSSRGGSLGGYDSTLTSASPGGGYGQHSLGLESEIVEDFITNSLLDDRAADKLRGLEPDLQKMVIEVGTLANAANPSSALEGRIKQAKQQLSLMSMAGSGGFVPMGGGQPSAEVEAFIAESMIDDVAADAFRKLSSVEQGAVISKGTLAHAQNPSSAIMGRIRDIKKQIKANGGFSQFVGAMLEQPGGGQSSVEVEQFILESGVDPVAADALRKLDPVMQLEVISVGHLKNAKNPSSALVGRIKQMKQQIEMTGGHTMGGGMGGMGSMGGKGGMGGMGGMGGGMGSHPLAAMRAPEPPLDPVIAMQIEQFLMESGVDEIAAAKFRKLSQAEQAAVISIGHLQNAKNPSSALQGRIKQVQMQAAQGTSPQMQAMQMMAGSMAGSPAGMAGVSGAPTIEPTGDYVDPDVFLLDAGADDRSKEAFKTLSPEEQQAVINVGTVKHAANPSSAIMGRIKAIKNQQYQAKIQGGGGVAAASLAFNSFGDFQDVHQFIADSGVDEKAAQDLLNLSPEAQQAVMAKGVLTHATNPSSALMSRIKQVSRDMGSRATGGGGGGMGGMGAMGAMGAMAAVMSGALTGMGGFGGMGGKGMAGMGAGGDWSGHSGDNQAVEDFIIQSGLDERASSALLGLDPALQQQVMSIGHLQNATNPSSALLGRIKQMQKQRYSPY